MISPVLLLLLLLAACYTHEAEQTTGCHRLITDQHLRNLTDMRDSQMMTTCKQLVLYVDKNELGNTECFLKAAYAPLKTIIHAIKFKRNSPNSKKLEDVKDLHLKLATCFNSYDDDESKRCVKSVYLTAEEVLNWVHNYFREAQEFLSKGKFIQDCSSVFQNCLDSQEKETPSPGVVTDRDCECPATSPIYGGGSASVLPASEPFSSMADQLDSKETAASTLQLPGTTQMQSGSEGSTRPRVLRSTHVNRGTAESMDFRADTDAVTSPSPEELALSSVSQGPDSLPMNTAPLLDPAIILHPTLKNVPPSPSSQQHFESVDTKSLPPGSGAGGSQTWPNELPSPRSPLSGGAKPSLGEQWLWTRETDGAMIPRPASDWDRTVTSSMPRRARPSFASVEPVDGSGVPSSGNWVTLPPRDAELFPVLGSEDPVSAAQHPPRLAVTTESSASTPVGSYPQGEQWSRGRAPGVQESTQLRERRAEREEGLAEGREPEDSVPGPSFDQSFLPPNTDKHFKKSGPRDTQGMTVTYVTVPSVLGILLAVGGLLFYLHRSRILARRRQQRNESNDERVEEGRPLNGREEHVELQIQEEL
ncbi:macrophage colony-stimulating factor 1 [Elgaria multicarinata webbii]|uniref:macrophage colony-stimulating factor 1 n=1 Tax=Elgaria multicarinata webbii TaxID=159646 RepID=UPI002FCCF70C